jgi:transmembrane sensor
LYSMQGMNSDDIKYLLVKYITSQATVEEAMEVKLWIKMHPENEQYFIELYEAWHNALCARPDVVDDDKAYNLFVNKITPAKAGLKSIKWLSIAAIIPVALLITTAILLHKKGPIGPLNEIAAYKGNIKKITLADGTMVWLNSVSTIKYDAGFGKSNRTVYLEGEAFFDIAHTKTGVPFLVKTKNYTVRDIGTKFNLKAYPTDAFFETTVVKGEVSVEDNTLDERNANRIYVKPQQVLKISYHPIKDDKPQLPTSPAAFNEVHVSQLDLAKMDVYAGWKDDLLMFDGSTLGEITKVFERRYNVNINIADSDIKDIRYSGSFKDVKTIEKVLYIIKQNTPIDYAINGDNITITKIKQHLN